MRDRCRVLGCVSSVLPAGGKTLVMQGVEDCQVRTQYPPETWVPPRCLHPPGVEALRCLVLQGFAQASAAPADARQQEQGTPSPE